MLFFTLSGPQSPQGASTSVWNAICIVHIGEANNSEAAVHYDLAPDLTIHETGHNSAARQYSLLSICYVTLCSCLTSTSSENDYRNSSEATSMEESIDSNASTHTPRQEQNTGEDGPQAMKNKPADESSKNELSKRIGGENDNPKQGSHTEEVATSVEDNAVRKAKEVHQEGQHAPSENGTTSGESIISKEKEESRDSLAVPAVESNGKGPVKKALSSKTSSTSSSTSSSSVGAESGESFTPFEWPPQFDFTLDWEKLPFRLSYSTQNGASCGKCSYTRYRLSPSIHTAQEFSPRVLSVFSSCTGCPIKPDDEIVRFKQTNVPTIAIDWDPKLLREFLSVEQAQVWSLLASSSDGVRFAL